MTSADLSDHLGEIAIVGMAGRFPGARTLDEFWRNLRDGVESIRFYSEEELLAAGVDRELLQNPNYVRAGAIIPEIEFFDAPFFGFTPLEADITDPQHRLFLECAWEALENAAYVPGAGKQRTGVYAGTGGNTYFLNVYSDAAVAASAGAFQIEIGNDKDYLATRVAYKLNLTGPAITVQTGCSTSLVAVHLACQALIDYECDMALAGGVSVSSYQPSGYLYQEGGVRSADGHCRTFDAQAGGTIAGSGAGVVVLKRMADALAARDYIHAVIKSSAVNNDGAAKVGYTAPSIEGQAEVIAKALALAGVNAEKIGYVEAHGTATALGDPVEIAALTKCFRADTDKKGFCAIGSVKTNVGHLNVAAGVTGLIKTALALEHQMLPPSLHFVRPNPAIDFAGSPFRVCTQLTPWRSNGAPRVAGVSSFSIGGTNAHVVVAEAPAVTTYDSRRTWHLLTLSARTGTALDALATRLATHLKEKPETNPADLAYTLNTGRKNFSCRRMVVYRDIEEAIAALGSPDEKLVRRVEDEETRRSVVFMFPGQGAQHPGMAHDLYQTEPIFRTEVDRCAELLLPSLGLDIRNVLYAPESQAAEQLRQTCLVQPALFVTEYALAKLWLAWGLRPAAMIGHSLGEYVAACLAEVLSLEDALSLVAARGRLMQQLPEGAMLAVLLAEAAVLPLLGKDLALAAVNGPKSCVVSGPAEKLSELEELLAKDHVPSRRLDVTRAFHSAAVEQIAAEFAREVSRVKLRPPQIPYVSNLTGAWIKADEATARDYWVQHLRHTVRFSEGISQLLADPTNVLLEVGPGQTLGSLARQHVNTNSERLILSSLGKSRQTIADVPTILETLGQLWLAGAFANWQEFYSGEQRQRLPLPTYPFERERFWIENKANGSMFGHDPLERKAAASDWLYVPVWRQSLRSRELETGQEQALCWLIFLDEYGVGTQLVERLKERAAVIVTVEAGRFLKQGEDRYTIDLEQPKDYARLLDELAGEGKAPSRIVHLSTIAPPASSAIESYETSLRRGYQSLLFLASALGDRQQTEPVSLFAISNNIHNVIGNDGLRPEAAILLGACKVIPKDFPQLSCRSIDLDLPAPGNGSSVVNAVAQLAAELNAEASAKVIALRGERRWVQMFEAIKPSDITPRLREGSVYLLTGIWSEIGFAVAEHLVKDFSAKLIVVDDDTFPPRSEWQQWLETHDEDEALTRKLRMLLSLETSGAEVHVFTADLTSLDDMRQVVAEASQRLGQISGVFHMVAGPPARLIQLRTNAESGGDFDKRAKGALVLAEVFNDRPLDFLILFSSITSIIPGYGQVDECATSALLDAVAQARYRERGATVVAVNWPPWPSANPAEVKPGGANRQQIDERARYGLTPQEGVEVLLHVLSSGAPQVIVSTRDFSILVDHLHSLTTKDALDDLNRLRSLDSSHARRSLTSDYVAPSGAVEKMLADIWQDLFGIEQIGVHDDFLELGGHSLLAIQLITRVREAFQVELPLTSLFTAPTIAGLAEQITTRQLTPAELEELEQLYSEIENLSATDVKQQLADELHRLESQRQHGPVL